ncbi:hypothetical protein O9929_21710 [Vibrio lentus]|nr:hypothetical protein [Vibrio lentus]
MVNVHGYRLFITPRVVNRLTSLQLCRADDSAPHRLPYVYESVLVSLAFGANHALASHFKMQMRISLPQYSCSKAVDAI